MYILISLIIPTKKHKKAPKNSVFEPLYSIIKIIQYREN